MVCDYLLILFLLPQNSRFMRLILLFTFLLPGLFPLAVFAQSQTDLEQAIQRQSFVFKPSFIVLESGFKRQFAHPETYYLRVTPDSIICYLPTPKRRYKPGGIKMVNGHPDFSAISFEERFRLRHYRYKVKEEVKNEVQIQLVPSARGRVEQVRLNVLPGGGTTLTVATTEYEPIIYAGRLIPVNKSGRRH